MAASSLLDLLWGSLVWKVDWHDGEVCVCLVCETCKHVVKAEAACKDGEKASSLEQVNRGNELRDGEEEDKEPDHEHQQGQCHGGLERADPQKEGKQRPREEEQGHRLSVLAGGRVAGSNAAHVHQHKRIRRPEAAKHEERARSPGVPDDKAEHAHNDLDKPRGRQEGPQERVGVLDVLGVHLHKSERDGRGAERRQPGRNRVTVLLHLPRPPSRRHLKRTTERPGEVCLFDRHVVDVDVVVVVAERLVRELVVDPWEALVGARRVVALFFQVFVERVGGHGVFECCCAERMASDRFHHRHCCYLLSFSVTTSAGWRRCCPFIRSRGGVPQADTLPPTRGTTNRTSTCHCHCHCRRRPLCWRLQPSVLVPLFSFPSCLCFCLPPSLDTSPRNLSPPSPPAGRGCAFLPHRRRRIALGVSESSSPRQTPPLCLSPPAGPSVVPPGHPVLAAPRGDDGQDGQDVLAQRGVVSTGAPTDAGRGRHVASNGRKKKKQEARDEARKTETHTYTRNASGLGPKTNVCIDGYVLRAVVRIALFLSVPEDRPVITRHILPHAPCRWRTSDGRCRDC